MGGTNAFKYEKIWIDCQIDYPVGLEGKPKQLYLVLVHLIPRHF